jgi:hypothetical protein
MTSAINPNNIDIEYPIAGQDNNTQGFRTNFTNIKNNFQAAETEINDLQNKVLLKSSLTGGTLNNDLSGSLIYNGQIQDFALTRVALGTVAGTPIGIATINYASAHYHTVTTGSSIALAFTNFPAAGTAAIVKVQVTVTSVAHTLQLPSEVTVNNVGIQGLTVSGITGVSTITFAAAGVYEFTFETYTNGSTITVSQTNSALTPLNNSNEDLAAGAAASLLKTTSYFSTAAAETATLAAGVEGQIKTFAMVATSGDMVITVANAGWKTSGAGTVTFDTIGDACTLQYVNSKWFCIGNNGCTFA